MIGEWTNHVWQSTLFAFATGALTIAFRQNRAKVRYWLWLSASFKFLIPLSLLMSVGSHLEWAPAAKRLETRTASFPIVQIAQPFPDTWSSAPVKPGAIDWAPITIVGMWAFGFLA